MKPAVTEPTSDVATPHAGDRVDETAPVVMAAPVVAAVAPSEASGTTAAASADVASASASDHTPGSVRGTHYVVAPGLERAVEAEGDGQSVWIVTGEAPPDYNRITVECEDGDVVEATILDQRPAGGATLFVAPVSHRVLRIVATKAGGVYGIFLDVGLMEPNSGDPAGENPTT